MTFSAKNLTYPITKQIDHQDAYHGITVRDPYRWLEEPDTEETRDWVIEQNKVTQNYLAKLSRRTEIEERLTQLWDYAKYSSPFKRGERYFYFKNDGLQNQSILYTLESLADQGRILLDPNTLSTDGTVALSGLSISDDGQWLAYGLSSAGSDWQEYRVRNVATGQDTTDLIKWVKFSRAAWSKDHQGFFYSRYDEPDEQSKFAAVNYFQKLYYHRLGTSQAEDVLIYQRPDHKEWGFSGNVTEDGTYLIINVWLGTDSRNLLFYQNLEHPGSQVTELISEFAASYQVIDHDGDIFWVQTDLDAPCGKVVAIDLKRPEPENWQEIIPEAAETMQGVNLLHNQFIVKYLKDARSQVKVFDLEGNLVREVELPGIGSVSGFSGKRSDTEAFYTFTNATTPPTIYRYDATTGHSQLFRQPEVSFDPDDYETHQVFYPSKDGTKIPMFITYKRGLALDGCNPTYLYGYGGFNISLTPSFSVSNLVWLEMGGILAIPNLRGGGEYGEAWHQAGMKANKQNVFDDFIAAAEWLIAEQYTSSSQLAIAGGSNGGLLVGACMVQRPELFAAALPAVGVLDMLRFPKFTIGWAWCSEYGDPAQEADFKTLYAYSPLHNLQPGTNYPATLITTADHDDRVVPAHSFKFAAALQSAHQGDNPVLIRIETKAGHGAGKPTSKIIAEAADKWAFLKASLRIS